MSSPVEVGTWVMAFGVSETELRRAVAATGTQADKVREYLRLGT